ncbi:MAG: efflux RND transporter permease subunit [Epsilonproteobacteria bacterium]|nr:efflux RND transporter permease subunit [Campylobacterota bacterium]
MIRAFVRFAVEKAILNHILFILMLILAIFAYKKIPKELLPSTELDKIVVSGGYVGASGDILDKMAVKEIEEDLKNVDNIDEITSNIRNGVFTITLDLKEDANPVEVLNDVKDVIANNKKDLPSDMDEPVAKILVHQFPLLLIAISGDVPKERLLEAAKALKSRLSQIKELGNIDIRGDADYEIKIELNNKKIEAYNLTKELVYSAISSLSSIYPAGTIKFRGNKVYISSVNGEKEVKRLQNTILNIGGVKVRLKDIANVSFGLSDSKEISNFNGKENISLNVTKSKKGNAIELSKRVREILREFSKEYKDINFEVYTDTSIWIRNRINLVTSNIMFGLILVFISIFLSVNWRISLVVALGIPTSFFIGLIVANYLGYSINMLSMLGVLLALGMLVDEAIVVAENIFRHLEMGKTPKEAAIDGAVEMFPAVLTATATTIFAFLPLLIMSGKMGMFIKILPVMISILLLSSLFEAFYFLPLHAKELFSIGKIEFSHKKSRFWETLKSIYEKILYFLLRYKKSSLAILVVAILVTTFLMLKNSKFELFPKFDAEQIYLSGKVDVNSKLKETQALMLPLEKALLQALSGTDVASITSIVGIKFNPDNSFESGEHLFHIFINLKERAPQNFFDKYINPYLSLEYDSSNMVRQKSAFEILEDAQKVIKEFEKKEINGTKIFKELTIYVPQTGVVGNDIEIGVIENSKLNVDFAINKLMEELKKIEGVMGVSSNKKDGPLELKLKINRYGQELGFSEKYLINSLRGLFLEAEYGKMLGDIGIIRMKLSDENKDRDFNIKNLLIYTPDRSKRVALKEIVDFIYQTSPLIIYKEDGQRVWSVTAQTKKGVITASEVMKRLKPTLDELRKMGYKFKIKGEAKENKKVFMEMKEAAIIAMFLIFISLVLMFNSLVLPLIVLSVIPLSILGALVGNYVMGINLTMPGLMGIVGLAGVVVNDAIIMLLFIKEAKSLKEIAKRATTRLRPIMLTSITTILGLSTLIFFASGQALIIQPMAIALGFGVAWATILNLIYIPLLFATIYRIRDEKAI